MESINKVEIAGTVSTIVTAGIGVTRTARLSVATDYIYRDVEGNPVIETTWHRVVAFQGKGIENLDNIVKGSKVHIIGRLRNVRYTGVDGNEQQCTEILASELTIINE